MGVGVDMGWAGVSPSIHPSIHSFILPSLLTVYGCEREEDGMGWDGMGKKREWSRISRQGKQHRTLSDVSSNSPRTVTLRSLLYVVYVAVLVRLPSAL